MRSRHATHRRLLVLLSIQLAAAAAMAEEDLRVLGRKAKESVVLLRIFDATNTEISNGSGFYVARDLLVSNQHVVEGAARVEAVSAEGQSREVIGIAAIDRVNDLVALKVAAAGVSPLVLSRRGDIEAGERIIVLGSPLGLSGTLTEGIVSAVRSDGLGEFRATGAYQDGSAPVLQISAPISPGSSGSPVLDLEGEVIGVAVSQMRFGQNLNFAVPSAAVRDLMIEAENSLVIQTYGGPNFTGIAYGRNLAISVVFFAVVLWLVYGKKPRRRRRLHAVEDPFRRS